MKIVQNCLLDEWILIIAQLLRLLAKLGAFSQQVLLKVSKYRKQNTKFSYPPKNQQNFVHFFALASKKWLKQKIKALDDLN